MDKRKQLINLFESQKLAVLATQSEGQPHNCLVAFAYTNDLHYLLFATRRDTRKFHDITVNPPVAMLIDNRSNGEADFQKAVAVTAKGPAIELGGRERDSSASLYLKRHPYLSNFIEDKNVALLKIEVEEYLMAQFDSTEVITPN